MLSCLRSAVRGSGVAASCCRFLLKLPSEESDQRARLPAIMIGEPTQALLGEVFDRQDLFSGLWPIRRRIVRWGAADTVDLPHRAIVVSEAELLERLRPPTPEAPMPKAPVSEPDWTIHTARLPEGGTRHGFGTREAAAAQVSLSPRADATACVMESMPSGWLFLVPVSADTAWLLAAGAEREALLEESRLVRSSVGEVIGEGGRFPAYPRIVDPLAGNTWLACGSAALAFDPLCGDGTGQAVREAILACAVIEAASGGVPQEELIEEYRLRLRAGFARHLQICEPFYATGGDSAWWQAEHAPLREGLAWLAERPGQARFQLRGLHLERRSDLFAKL